MKMPAQRVYEWIIVSLKRAQRIDEIRKKMIEDAKNKDA